jgi:hypothetical protein
MHSEIELRDAWVESVALTPSRYMLLVDRWREGACLAADWITRQVGLRACAFFAKHAHFISLALPDFRIFVFIIHAY